MPHADPARARPRPCAHPLPIAARSTTTAHPDSRHSTGTGALAHLSRELLSRVSHGARLYASSRAIPISLIARSYSPKYLSAIWIPSSYIFWKLAWNWSPRFVLREKNSMTCAIVVRFCLSSASIFVVDPTSMRPSRS